MTSTTAQADTVQTTPPPPTDGRDIEGVISFVESQLRQLSELCVATTPPEQRPMGLTLDELTRQRDAILQAGRALAEREAELRAWHERLQSTQGRLATEHETVAGTLEQRRTELNSLDGSLRVRSAEVASRRESLAAREASLTAAEGELAERERRFAAARQSLDRRSSELDAAATRLEERAARLAERAETVRTAESSADARASVISQHESSLEARAREAAERAAGAAEITTLRATIASLEARLAEAESRPTPPPVSAAATEEIERLSRQRDSLARELSDRERIVEQLSADCLVLRADADGALSRAAEQDRQIRRLEGRLAESLAEISGEAGNLENQRALLRTARSEAASAQQRLESFRSELDLRHEEVTERAHELDIREAQLERREAALELAAAAPRATPRPDMPGVTAGTASGLTVPAAWVDWTAPRRRRSVTGGSVDPFPRR